MVGECGYFTIHCLRRTCATRLYQQGVDKQKIMSITGHQSVNAVRIHQEISHEQQEEMCDLIQPRKKIKSGETREPEAGIVNEECTNSSTPMTTPTFNFSSCTVTLNYK